MKPLLFILLLSSTCHAGICGRPCGYLPTIYPTQCQPMELDPCVQLVMDAITEPQPRGVGNLAHLSQTGSDGGPGFVTGSFSSFIGWDFDGGGFGPFIGGGSGSGIIGVPNVPGSENGNGSSSGNGSGGTEIPSSEIPEPGSVIVWALILLGVWAWIREV